MVKETHRRGERYLSSPRGSFGGASLVGTLKPRYAPKRAGGGFLQNVRALLTLENRNCA